MNEEFPRVASASLPEGVAAAEAEQEMLDAESVTTTAAEGMLMDGVMSLLTGAFRYADNFHQGSGTAPFINSTMAAIC